MAVATDQFGPLWQTPVPCIVQGHQWMFWRREFAREMYCARCGEFKHDTERTLGTLVEHTA